MPKYRVVTPKGASFTVAGSDYSYEREALDPIDAEIVEAPANEAEFIAAAKNADAIYAKGIPITKTSSTAYRAARSSRSARSASTVLM
jgi:D-3-phosphoglycerate dehydrogenase / 2-oxoglutarate reductase